MMISSVLLTIRRAYANKTIIERVHIGERASLELVMFEWRCFIAFLSAAPKGTSGSPSVHKKQ